MVVTLKNNIKTHIVNNISNKLATCNWLTKLIG